jgi:lipoprotein-releasing system ATP-binding protein
MSAPLIVIQDLHKTFFHMGRDLHVLRGIDLTIDQGEVVAIVGASGAGKSTLLHCVGTLDIPTKGRIQLGGELITGLSSSRLAHIRNRTIGFVFQFHHLLPEFNALENVMMPGLIQGRSRKEMAAPATALLKVVGLDHRATHRPGELSGGEQQRVALARALVLSPKLILADEPTGNLDSKTGGAMHDLFFEINEKYKTTIVVVTHNSAFAASMPRVITMRDGRIDTDERREGGMYSPSHQEEGKAADADASEASASAAASVALDAALAKINPASLDS